MPKEDPRNISQDGPATAAPDPVSGVLNEPASSTPAPPRSAAAPPSPALAESQPAPVVSGHLEADSTGTSALMSWRPRALVPPAPSSEAGFLTPAVIHSDGSAQLAPQKKERKRKPKPITDREKVILNIPRTVGLKEYCERMAEAGQTVPTHWDGVIGPTMSHLAAYKSRNKGLIDNIENERKNAWVRRDKGLI